MHKVERSYKSADKLAPAEATHLLTDLIVNDETGILGSGMIRWNTC